MFFKKSKPPQSNLEQQISATFAKRFEDAKRKLADFLQMKSDLLSIHQKKTVVIIAVLMIAAMCIGCIVKAWRTHSYADQLNAGSLTLPKIVVPGNTMDTVLSKEEYQQILKLKSAIDSLPLYRRKFSDTVRK